MKLRATYANVAATAALVISLSGTAYAATVIYSSNIADNTILSRDVHDGTLRSVDVADGSLTSADVLNGSLTGADVKDGSLGLADLSSTAKDGLRGEPGPKGDPGLKGDPGVDGTAGISGYVDIAGDWGSGKYASGENLVTARAFCPAGKKPISGGFETSMGSMAFAPHYSHHVTWAPGWNDAYPNGVELWEVEGHALNGIADQSWSLRAWVTCAYVQ